MAACRSACRRRGSLRRCRRTASSRRRPRLRERCCSCRCAWRVCGRGGGRCASPPATGRLRRGGGGHTQHAWARAQPMIPNRTAARPAGGRAAGEQPAAGPAVRRLPGRHARHQADPHGCDAPRHFCVLSAPALKGVCRSKPPAPAPGLCERRPALLPMQQIPHRHGPRSSTQACCGGTFCSWRSSRCRGVSFGIGCCCS